MYKTTASPIRRMWCYRSGLKDLTPKKPTATTIRKQTRSTSSELSYRTKQSHPLHRVRMERRWWLLPEHLGSLKTNSA